MQVNSADKTKYALTIWLFLRGLGLVYFFAFLSLSGQILGLFGENGILPAAQFLQMIEANMGTERFCLLPTIFWLNASDAALVIVCLLGILFSLFVILGVSSGFSFICLWLLYLSLSGIGQDFLSFQWDALLLETGFLAIFLASWQFLEWPWKIKFGNFKVAHYLSEPAVLFVWLVRWLLFRLMFESGLVKLASGDSTWRDLSALDFHYFTQPLPMPLAWYVAQAPHWFNAMSVVLVFIIELAVPFLIFTGRKTRIIAAFLITGLQILIAATGNYAYFNLLTIVLCICLLDDQFIQALLHKKLLAKYRAINFLVDCVIERINEALPAKNISKGRKVLVGIAAAFIICVSIGSLARGFAGLLPIPQFITQVHSWVSPYCIANSYGLFAVMTIKRPEIIVEGSNDGVLWQEYEFKYKPGNLAKALPIVAPHQPRLDWQMWFAALGDPAHEPWCINFLLRLLQGKSDVLGLLAKNPFPANPPKYIRASLYDYHFTNLDEYQKSGKWWKREFLRDCVPALSLEIPVNSQR